MDCLLILTEWDEFANANIKKINNLMKAINIIDCVYILQKGKRMPTSINYQIMGKG